jgi:hypothetical protein
VGRPDGKIPLGRPRSRQKNNIKIDLNLKSGMGRHGLN